MQQDANQLFAKYNLDASTLKLTNGSELSNLQVVRHVPNRRIVCSGVWQNKKVYAKLFFGKSAQRYATRDAAGVTYMQAAAIKTPALLYQGELANRQGLALIFEEVPNAENAESLWQNSDKKAHFNLAQKLVQAVAQHHNAGLIQTDLYLKNFLVQGKKVITLDGDGIRQFASLSEQKALKNLAVLFSKFDVLELESWLPELLETYAKTKAWQGMPDSVDIKNSANKHRRLVASNYANKKVFRMCTDVHLHALRGLFYAASTAYSALDLPTSTDILDAAITPQTRIKNGKTCTVATTLIGDKKIVIKRYNIKGFWHGASRALRQTRAATSWANAHRLRLLDIATAKPIALIEERKFFLKGKSYFLAEYIDAPNVAEYFKQIDGKSARATTIKQIAILFYRLFLLQLSHGDMKATNIKILDGQPVLIDLDSMQQHNQARRALQAHVRDLRRFMQNWQAEPALYNAFVKAFRVVYKDQSPLDMANFQNELIA